MEAERDMMRKLSDLESELNQIRSERDELYQAKRQNEEEVTTLKRTLKQNEKKLMNQLNILESKNQELQTLTKSLPKGSSITEKLNEISSVTNGFDKEEIVPPIPPPPPATALNPAPAPPPPPGPPPPPLPTLNNSSNSTILQSFIPPPPVGMPALDGAMTIKRKVQTKYKLPTLNWIALKPNQVIDVMNVSQSLHLGERKRQMVFPLIISNAKTIFFRFVAQYLTNWTTRNYTSKLTLPLSKNVSKLVSVDHWPMAYRPSTD